MGLRANISVVVGSALLAASFSTAHAHADTGTIQNDATKFCLDVNPGVPANANIVTQTCSEDGFQNWVHTSNPGTIKNVAAINPEGLCLDNNTTGSVTINPCNGSKSQQWTIERTGPTGPGPIRNVATALCLDSNAENKVHTSRCNNLKSQQWIK